MDNKLRIVRLMSDGAFHSGEVLAESCGISRAAVWKHLKQIEIQFRLKIHSVRGRGYRLSSRLDLLDSAKILSLLSGDMRQRIPVPDVLLQVDSTNRHLAQKAGAGLPSDVSCFAEQQTAGRGRRGREWVSPFGNNIYMSIYRKLNIDITAIGGLSLGVGIACVEALSGLGVTGIGLKWPNDILFDERKLAGILIEVTGEQGGAASIVVGIGVNTRMDPVEAKAIDQPWCDLAEIGTNQELSRNLLAARLLEGAVRVLDRFEQYGFSPMRDHWNRYDIYLGKRIVLLQGVKSISGIHRGVNEQGALLLECEGPVVPFHGGELSLRQTVENRRGG